jgi:hypothetical protein
LDTPWRPAVVARSYRGLSTSGIGGTGADQAEANRGKSQLNTQLKFAETSILPALDKSIGVSEQLVKKYAADDD